MDRPAEVRTTRAQPLGELAGVADRYLAHEHEDRVAREPRENLVDVGLEGCQLRAVVIVGDRVGGDQNDAAPPQGRVVRCEGGAAACEQLGQARLVEGQPPRGGHRPAGEPVCHTSPPGSKTDRLPRP